MRLRKTLISFLLIFSYSIGFAHNAIPHCDEEHGNNVHHSHEQNHQHASSEELNSEHSHFAHNDHFDHGFIDLLICALESSSHHNGACESECYNTITDYSSIKTVNNSNHSSDFISSNDIFESNITTVDYSTNILLNSSKEYLILYPYRGPPSII